MRRGEGAGGRGGGKERGDVRRDGLCFWKAAGERWGGGEGEREREREREGEREEVRNKAQPPSPSQPIPHPIHPPILLPSLHNIPRSPRDDS